MSVYRISLRFVLSLACISLFVFSAHAQYRASIQGVVTDPAGSAVGGATVTLTNEETNQLLTTATNDEGVYNFNSLPPSHFTLTIEKTGFKKKVVQGDAVISEQANSVSITLEVGQAAETLTVSGDSVPLIDTETANLTGTVNAQDIQKLPSIGRDPFQLLQLAPGAFGDGSQASGGGTKNLPGTTVCGTGATERIFKLVKGSPISSGAATTGRTSAQF